MSSNNDGSGGNNSYALSISEKNMLTETRRFTKECENKIAEDKANFADKSSFGLWWDAKGLFNCSDVKDVTAHMEKYEELYKKVHNFSAQVEKGDPESYKKLRAIYKDLDEMETDALSDVENNQSSAICRMLREFLNKKYNLVHNLKKVECIVLKRETSDAIQARERSEVKISKMNESMDNLREKNSAILRKCNELMQVLEEAEERSEARIEEMRKQNAEQRLEAEKRSEERLSQVLKEAEERSEARLQNMKEECDKLRLEAEIIRRESEEKLKQAVEEANRRSEARMQEMAEQNRANLQNITKMLEAMNVP